MVASVPLTALRAESARLSAILAGLSAQQWRRPTRCEPWDAAALVAHITTALQRLDVMLDAPPPAAATVSAAGYYTADERFSPEANATRVDSALEAARIGGSALTAQFADTWRGVVERCKAAPPGRPVTTRHGDPMTLEDFLVTRVVEVAVHGVDLADAVGLPRWTTAAAAEVVVGLLLGECNKLEALGWEPVAFIARATGRDPLEDAERERVDALGLTWLALG